MAEESNLCKRGGRGERRKNRIEGNKIKTKNKTKKTGPRHA